MDDFLGKEYILVSSEYFEDYLEFMGVNGFLRKIGSTLKPIQRLTRCEDGTYSFIFKSKLANSNTKFTPGVEFEETKADGVKVQALITFEGNKMIHIQKEKNGKISKHVREFHSDKLIISFMVIIMMSSDDMLHHKKIYIYFESSIFSIASSTLKEAASVFGKGQEQHIFRRPRLWDLIKL